MVQNLSRLGQQILGLLDYAPHTHMFRYILDNFMTQKFHDLGFNYCIIEWRTHFIVFMLWLMSVFTRLQSTYNSLNLSILQHNTSTTAASLDSCLEYLLKVKLFKNAYHNMYIVQYEHFLHKIILIRLIVSLQKIAYQTKDTPDVCEPVPCVCLEHMRVCLM